MLAHYRARLKQGDILKAEVELQQLRIAAHTAAQQLLAEMEWANLIVLRNEDYLGALGIAEKAWQSAGKEHLSPVEWAEADRVYIRLQLTADTYYVISTKQASKARDRLPSIAENLAKAGKAEEALAAHLTYLQRLDGPPESKAYKNIVDKALATNRPDFAGDTCLAYAQTLEKQNQSDLSLIKEALTEAEGFYHQAKHQYGVEEAEVLRIKIDTTLSANQKLEALNHIRQHFEEVQNYRGLTSILMDLSLLAHQSGNLELGTTYGKSLLDWSEKSGLGIAADSFVTAQADLLIRNADYGEAVKLCQKAISQTTSPMSRALYEQLLAAAYAFLTNYTAAQEHGLKALRQFEKIGADDAASDCALKHAADLLGFRTEKAWQKAEELLVSWIAKDRQRSDIEAVVAKLELRVQIDIQRFLFSSTQGGNFSLISSGESLISEAKELAQTLSDPAKTKQLANLAQLRGQLRQSRGDEDGVITAWQEALHYYEQIGFAMETANCKYIIGTIHLNRTNQVLQPNFGIAESNLLLALEYYATANMRSQAIDTRYMLALLYKNTALRQAQPLNEKLLDAALEQLAAATTDAEAIRMSYGAGRSVLDTHQGKQALGKNRHRVDQLALEICCQLRPNPNLAWEWVQHTKARALADMLGAGTRVPAELQQDSTLLQLLEQEQQLIDKLNLADARFRTQINEELSTWRQEMLKYPKIANYLNLRQGSTPSQAEMQLLLAKRKVKKSDTIYIDWIAIGNRLYLLSLKTNEPPKIYPLDISLSALTTFVQNELASESFRSNLKFIPNLFERLNALVEPLGVCSRPEDLLVLCPTGPLHRLPLHALQVKGQFLIERNPIIYTPSSAVWRYCMLQERAELSSKQTAVFFGDPRGDRPVAARIVEQLASLFSATTLLRTAVTKTSFSKISKDKNVVHFQGHAVHKTHHPLESYLELADGPLSARDIFEGITLKADLVSLAACETATAAIEPGDEPLGLVPAFLYAGASTVLATLWKVNEESAAQCMQSFFTKHYTINSPVKDKAQALRTAILELKQNPRFARPYHWAPFILSGNWQ